jgi:hypothetical protein
LLGSVTATGPNSNLSFMDKSNIVKTVKTCLMCKDALAVSCFYKSSSSKDGYQYWCKSCSLLEKKVYQKKEENAPKIQTIRQKYRSTHNGYKPDPTLISKLCPSCKNTKPSSAFALNCHSKNGYKSQCKDCSNRKTKERRKDHQPSPKERFVQNLRVRCRLALDGKLKAAPTRKMLGCSWDEAIERIKYMLEPGWDIENAGNLWEVDHIRPVSKFNLEDPEQQYICFHHSNLQPLSCFANRSKHDKYNPKSFDSAWIVADGYTWRLCDNKRYKLPELKGSK